MADARLRRREMAEERVEVSIDGLSRLQSAARDFARAEIDRIVSAIIEELRSRRAVGIFDEVRARHLWDEYCWALQEGPFDDPMIIEHANLGSLSGGFDGLLQAHIMTEVEKLPKHAQIFLSAVAFEEDVQIAEKAHIGGIWIDGIVKVVTDAA